MLIDHRSGADREGPRRRATNRERGFVEIEVEEVE